MRALRILLGVDLSQSADGALEWIAALGKFGRCDVIEAHLYWPPQQFERLGLAGLHSYIDPDPAVTETLCAAFVKRSQRILKVPPLKLHVEPHLGRVADRLATIADEEHADLIVVGSHARGLRGRMLHGSVSHDILHSARVSVVTVPPKAATKSSSERTAKNVLVATDFSPVANTAIPLAYGIVADGGTVHLVHVIEDDAKSLEPRDIFSASTTAASERETAARQRLIDLIPEPHGRAVASTETHVLCSNHPARAVCQAAERLDADVICLGTHHHVGVAKLLLGSVASAVLSATERPVLFTRLPRE